jgi:hypothetical protein
MTITLTREEAQSVLDALICSGPHGWSPNLVDQHNKALKTLRTRLSAPESKPVAWFIENTFMDGSPSFIQVCETDPEFYTPLYRAPQREWQGLTDEEIVQLLGGVRERLDGNVFGGFARAIEAKLKEKNNE